MTNESHSIQFHSEQRLQNKITSYMYHCRLMKLHVYGIQQDFERVPELKTQHRFSMPTNSWRKDYHNLFLQHL